MTFYQCFYYIDSLYCLYFYCKLTLKVFFQQKLIHFNFLNFRMKIFWLKILDFIHLILHSFKAHLYSHDGPTGYTYFIYIHRFSAGLDPYNSIIWKGKSECKVPTRNLEDSGGMELHCTFFLWRLTYSSLPKYLQTSSPCH